MHICIAVQIWEQSLSRKKTTVPILRLELVKGANVCAWKPSFFHSSFFTKFLIKFSSQSLNCYFASLAAVQLPKKHFVSLSCLCQAPVYVHAKIAMTLHFVTAHKYMLMTCTESGDWFLNLHLLRLPLWCNFLTLSSTCTCKN